MQQLKDGKNAELDYTGDKASGCLCIGDILCKKSLFSFKKPIIIF
jgi:hypothetical protein